MNTKKYLYLLKRPLLESVQSSAAFLRMRTKEGFWQSGFPYHFVCHRLKCQELECHGMLSLALPGIFDAATSQDVSHEIIYKSSIIIIVSLLTGLNFFITRYTITNLHTNYSYKLTCTF